MGYGIDKTESFGSSEEQKEDYWNTVGEELSGIRVKEFGGVPNARSRRTTEIREISRKLENASPYSVEGKGLQNLLDQKKLQEIQDRLHKTPYYEELHELLKDPNNNEQEIATVVVKVRKFVDSEEFWRHGQRGATEGLSRYRVIRTQEDYQALVKGLQRHKPDISPFFTSEGDTYQGDIKYFHWTKNNRVGSIMADGLFPALLYGHGVAPYAFAAFLKDNDWWGSDIGGVPSYEAAKENFTQLEIDGKNLPMYMWVPVLHNGNGWVEKLWNGALISSEVFGLERMIQQMLEHDVWLTEEALKQGEDKLDASNGEPWLVSYYLNRPVPHSCFSAAMEYSEVLFDYVAPKRIKRV